VIAALLGALVAASPADAAPAQSPAPAEDAAVLVATAAPPAPLLLDGTVRDGLAGGLPLAPGEHQLSVAADDCYDAATISVTLTAGETTQVELPRSARTVRLTASGSSTDGAVDGTILADGLVLGRFPGVVELPRCAGRIELRAEGHDPWLFDWAPGRESATSLHADLVVDPDWDGLPTVSGAEWMTTLPRPDAALARGWTGVVAVRVLVAVDGEVIASLAPQCTDARRSARQRKARIHSTACVIVEPGPPRALVRDVLDAFAGVRFRRWGRKADATRYWFETELLVE